MNIIKNNSKSKLIQLAGQMVRCMNMPSSEIEDYNFKKCTAKSDIRSVLKKGEIAQEQCKLWAIELRKIIDDQ
jgi:hypothetical protein